MTSIPGKNPSKIKKLLLLPVLLCPVGDTDYYTVTNYGVISKRIHAPSGLQNWNLIRWKIVK